MKYAEINPRRILLKSRKNSLIFDWLLYIKLVEVKSFSVAARELSLSVATVSKVLTRLEDIFSVRLISRNAHRFEVTSAGEVAYEYALKMCETYHTLLTGLDDRGEIRGEMRLSAPGILCDNVINDWIIEFTTQHPAVTIHLLSREAGSFTSDSPEFDDLVLKSGYLDSPDLIQKELNPVPFGMYASGDYLRTYPVIREPGDLNGHRLLRLSHASLRYPITLRNGQSEKKIRISAASEFHSNSVSSLLHMARKGKGICIAVPRWTVSAQQHESVLTPVLPHWELPPLRAYMVWRYRRTYSPLFRDFSAFVAMKWNSLFQAL